MAEKDDKKYFFDKPKNIRWMMRSFYAICILLVIADFIIIPLDGETVPAFYAIFGFVACVVLVVLAKAMRKVVMRQEDYYDE